MATLGDFVRLLSQLNGTVHAEMSGRFIIYGAGAVGGVIGGSLALAGHDVALIARGDHLAAIQRKGLELHTERGVEVVQTDAVADPGDLALSADDVVLLSMKTQDTIPALDRLAEVAPPEIAVVCVQNGVENERLALRRFPNVYGISVMLPATFLEPGVVTGEGTPDLGVLDIGRSPSGVDDTAEMVAAALSSARFRSEADPAVMRHKYAKLLMNTANALDAACGRSARVSDLGVRARQEGIDAFAAAGIDVATPDEWMARRQDFTVTEVNGPRPGGSSWQSLARGSGTIEADYLNGEVVLVGREFGVPTPVNEALRRVANRMARERAKPGSVPIDELEALAASLS